MSDETQVEEEPVELRIELIEAPDPNDCLLVLNPPAHVALTNAVNADDHDRLLGKHIVQHLKDHHNYGSDKPEKPPINLRNEIRP